MKKILLLSLVCGATLVACQSSKLSPAESNGAPAAAEPGDNGTSSVSTEGPDYKSADFNEFVLESIAEMPRAGTYSVQTDAFKALKSAIQWDQEDLRLQTRLGTPSFCTSATYMVFLSALLKIRLKYNWTPGADVLKLLLVTGQADGVGVWGRWNANGPGTSRLFYELGLGENFDDWSKARPGDFMKIFWDTEIGKSERGHSVVFLGAWREGGKDYVKFWSSNQPDGMGEKTIEKSRAVRVVFSRVTRLDRLVGVKTLPLKDQYLAEMLTRRSTASEMASMAGIR